MESVKSLEKKIIGVLAVTVLVIIGLSFALMNEPLPFILGVIFGSAVSALHFLALGVTLKRAVNMPPGKAQGYTTRNYFIRYIITAIVVYVSIVAPYIHILGTVVGLSLIKIIIYATNLFNDKSYFKNIIKRKEDEPSGQ